MANPHAATDSALGYYYQGMYALLVLFDTADDQATVLLEADDDIEKHDGATTLMQLAHSRGAPRPLTIHSVKIWKTLRIWSSKVRERDTLFVLVTVAAVEAATPLLGLTLAETEHLPACAALTAEAERVRNERELARAAGEPLPHEERWPGCEAYLDLTPAARESLVRRIRIIPNSPRLKDIDAQVATRLKPVTLPARRGPLVQRLLEWWSLRCVRELLRSPPLGIQKAELQQCINDLQLALGEASLPNDFGQHNPPSGFAPGTTMRRQIELVAGGEARISRATQVWWQALEQRRRWLAENLATGTELNEFDTQLINAWRDRHGPMCDDCAADRLVPLDAGRHLLDWSHIHAPIEVSPIREHWTERFLVQGTYQELAEEKRVGWHPTFKKLLEEA